MRAESWRALLFIALCVAVPATADEPPAATDDAAMDLEFLEYLGTLVHDGDEWVDPSDVAPPEETSSRAAQTLGLPPEWED